MGQNIAEIAKSLFVWCCTVLDWFVEIWQFYRPMCSAVNSNQSINKFISRHSTEARATVRLWLSCRIKEKCLKTDLKCVNGWSSSTVQWKRVPKSRSRLAATEKRRAAVSKLCGGTDRSFCMDDRVIAASETDCMGWSNQRGSLAVGHLPTFGCLLLKCKTRTTRLYASSSNAIVHEQCLSVCLLSRFLCTAAVTLASASRKKTHGSGKWLVGSDPVSGLFYPVVEIQKIKQ